MLHGTNDNLFLGDQQFNIMALEHLIKGFSLERPHAGKCLEASLATLRKEMGYVNLTHEQECKLTRGSEILEDASTMPQHGYLAKAMEPIYKSVAQTKGRGAPKERIAAFERQVCRMGGVWMQVRDSINGAFDRLFQETLRKLEIALGKNIDNLYGKFNMLCHDTVAKNETEQKQEDELIKELGKALIKAREMVQGPISQLAEECNNCSKIKEKNSLFVS